MAHAAVRLLIALLLTGGAAAGYDTTLDRRALADAMAIGQSRVEAVRTRFHRPYRIRIDRPPVDYIDVVTPFRRVVLTAEERGRVGDRLFRQSDAMAALAEHGNTLELLVEVTFHPLHNYVGVPPYVVSLVAAGSTERVAPVNSYPVPRFGLRVNGMPVYPPTTAPRLPSDSEPMLGGTVVAMFDSGRLDPQGTYDAVIEESGKELGRARVNLGGLR